MFSTSEVNLGITCNKEISGEACKKTECFAFLFTTGYQVVVMFTELSAHKALPLNVYQSVLLKKIIFLSKCHGLYKLYFPCQIH